MGAAPRAQLKKAAPPAMTVPWLMESSKKTDTLQPDLLMAETALNYDNSGQLRFVWF